MHWNAIALSVIAALALPVVGLITGRVVGDFFLRGDLIGATGAAFGVLVYALALASSYSHLRHYYKGYEAQGVRASWALALAVEVATFYMSFSYVVIHSAWAFWGSLIGAFVVFWGNLSSMYEARLERARAVQAAPDGRALVGEAPAPAVRAPAGGEEPIAQTQPLRATRGAAQARPQYEAIFLAAEAVETEVSRVRQSVQTVKAAVPPEQAWAHVATTPRPEAGSEPLPEVPARAKDNPLAGGPATLRLREPCSRPPQATDREPTPTPSLSEGDREVLRLAAEGPVGPSGLSRVLGIAKSSAGDRLKRLERMGLLVKRGSSYVPTSHAQASIEGGQALYQGAQAPR